VRPQHVHSGCRVFLGLAHSLSCEQFETDLAMEQAAHFTRYGFLAHHSLKQVGCRGEALPGLGTICGVWRQPAWEAGPRLQAEVIVHGASEPLLASQVAFGSLH
jgi:hypothetical protein